MPASSDRLTLVFSSLGHTLMHMLAAYFFVVVLALEVEWERPYHELIELWMLGALLIGLGALPAGWLADRWSAPGMMVVMFVGPAKHRGLVPMSTPAYGIPGRSRISVTVSVLGPAFRRVLVIGGRHAR